MRVLSPVLYRVVFPSAMGKVLCLARERSIVFCVGWWRERNQLNVGQVIQEAAPPVPVHRRDGLAVLLITRARRSRHLRRGAAARLFPSIAAVMSRPLLSRPIRFRSRRGAARVFASRGVLKPRVWPISARLTA